MEKVFHQIKAYLYPNHLLAKQNEFVPRVCSERTINVKEICESAVRRGGAPGTPEEMEYKVNLFLDEMAYLLCNGYAVNTGYFTGNAHLNGVFNSAGESFDPARHTLSFSFNQGELLRQEIKDLRVDILGIAKNVMFISEVTDQKTGSVNNIITPNRNLIIKGGKLKIAGNSETGVYLIHIETGNKLKIDPSDVVVNYPTELMIALPDLIPGDYKLEVVSQFTGNSLLKEPRSCLFEGVLTVR